MRVALFYHSLLSDWNHGNAHFLRGVANELLSRGHDVRVYEPRDSWSYQNLLKQHGDIHLKEFQEIYPRLTCTRYDLAALDLDQFLDAPDLVVVHEWNSNELLQRIADYRKRRNCLVLFHDTHHRSVSDSTRLFNRALETYDGVLAFGESVSERYRRLGWGTRIWTWHEAADVRVFRPIESPAGREKDLIWIGNWGDDERSRELSEFLLEPVEHLGLRAVVHGVRYPAAALDELQRIGIGYKGWIPNFRVPTAFSECRTTIHVPRQPYRSELPGVPTIRVFEALACGIPLVSAPWQDTEGLFSIGSDFLMARNGQEMKEHLRMLLHDPNTRTQIAAHGLKTILGRHTCAHRVDELLQIYRQLNPTLDGTAKPETVAIEMPVAAQVQPAGA